MDRYVTLADIDLVKKSGSSELIILLCVFAPVATIILIVHTPHVGEDCEKE